MAIRIKSITFDCADPYRLAQFWRQLTGFSEDPDNGNAPDDPEALLLSPDGSLALLFIAVPEPTHVKKRVHLDLVPLTSRRDEEVGQLLRIGARMVADQRRTDGGGWVVLSDPEGNEFCIERSDAERTPSKPAPVASARPRSSPNRPLPSSGWSPSSAARSAQDAEQMTDPANQGPVPTRLRCGIVVRVREDACEIVRDRQLCSVRYATPFPSPRTGRVSPGHLVAIATAPDGTEAVAWRWYDAVNVGPRGQRDASQESMATPGHQEGAPRLPADSVGHAWARPGSAGDPAPGWRAPYRAGSRAKPGEQAVR
jgi:catechol 2,3-dioxygenase-like lactoylglutathione lyase family enzyme